MGNPHGLSDFDKQPKSIPDRVRMLEAKAKESATVAARDKWEWSYKLSLRHQPVSSKVPDHYAKGKVTEAT